MPLRAISGSYWKAATSRPSANDTAPMTATGMAISNGHGVATTMTARKRCASPDAAHAAPAMSSATGAYHAAS